METLSWSSEVLKTPQLKLDVELGKYILTRGHATEVKHIPGRKEEALISWCRAERLGAAGNERRRVREQLCRRKESIHESPNEEASIVRGDTMVGVRSQRWGQRSTAGKLTGS